MAASQTGKKGKPNWKRISSEYIKGDIAMCPLAKKYGVPERTLKDHAKRERWSERRGEYRLSEAQKASAAVAEKEETAVAEEKRGTAPPPGKPAPVSKAQAGTEKVFYAADLLIERVIEVLEKEKYLDGKELSSLATAISKAKEIKHLRDALDIREQEARIAAMEKNNTPTEREPVQIEFIGKAGDTTV